MLILVSIFVAVLAVAIGIAMALLYRVARRRLLDFKRLSATTNQLRDTLDRLQRQDLATSRISQLEALVEGDVDTAVREIAEQAALAIGCERVNVWLFNADETELHCIELYEASKNSHSSGGTLREPDFRSEFEVLKYSRYVDADDPLTDPRTAGYVQPYLKPLRITSMLDTVIRLSGRNTGLLCFEHVDQPHHWEPDEIAFAGRLADKIGLVLTTRRRLESEQQLRASEEALAEAQTLAHVGSWKSRPNGQDIWSPEMYRIFGVTPETFEPTLENAVSRIHKDDRERVLETFRSFVAAEGDFNAEYRIVLDDGSTRFVHARGRIYRDRESGIQAIGTVQDITEQHTAAEQLQLANTILRTQMENSPDGILVVAADARILCFNSHFAEMWSVPETLLTAGDDRPVLDTVMAQVRNPDEFKRRIEELYANDDFTGHEDIETIDGRTIERHSSTLRGPNGVNLGRAWFFRDITDRKRAEALMMYSARHDALTGLVNRTVFRESVDQAVARMNRGGTGFAVLCLDVDHFKDVNDTLGHQAGDELLQQVAQRLRASCRATDTVSRFGGDEFAVLVSDVRDPEDAGTMAAALIAATSRPFILTGGDVIIGLSVGISLPKSPGADSETMLSQGDVALYRAKSEGRGTYCFFTDIMDEEVRTRVTLGVELREALITNQLTLHYQPQVNLTTGTITGVEALVRWNHPTRGLVGPARFIPIAERTGLIGAIGMWVLRESVRQLKTWRDQGLALDHVAVNLSALQFKAHQNLGHDLLDIIIKSGLDPSAIELELTETALMAATRDHDSALTNLRECGIRLAIDDFGTGYSSLDYLRRFRVDRIKIAREFVAQVTPHGGDAAIVRATIGLANELGIAVLAEGVESEEQLALLQHWGCDDVQGFLFSKPLPPAELEQLLKQGPLPWQTAPAAAGRYVVA